MKDHPENYEYLKDLLPESGKRRKLLYTYVTEGASDYIRITFDTSNLLTSVTDAN